MYVIGLYGPTCFKRLPKGNAENGLQGQVVSWMYMCNCLFTLVDLDSYCIVLTILFELLYQNGNLPRKRRDKNVESGVQHH